MSPLLLILIILFFVGVPTGHYCYGPRGSISTGTVLLIIILFLLLR